MSENFHVCLYVREGKLEGIATADDDCDFADELDGSSDEQKSSTFCDIFSEFSETMIGYIDMLPVVAAISQMVTRQTGINNVREVLGSMGELISENHEKITFRLPSRERSRWMSFKKGRRNGMLVGRQIPKMLLIGAVSALEHFEAMAISEGFRLRPEKYLPGDKTVSLADIQNSGSIDELKKRLRDKDVDQIMRDSPEKQVVYIERLFDLNESISKNYVH